MLFEFPSYTELASSCCCLFCINPNSETIYETSQNVMKFEVDLTITNPITSSNFCKSIVDLRIEYYPLGGTLYASSIITYAVFTNLKTTPSFSFHLPAHSTSSWQGMFFIYIRVQICFSFLKKSFWIFPMNFDRNPNQFIPKPTLAQSLLCIKTNDPGIDVGLQYY